MKCLSSTGRKERGPEGEEGRPGHKGPLEKPWSHVDSGVGMVATGLERSAWATLRPCLGSDMCTGSGKRGGRAPGALRWPEGGRACWLAQVV